MLDCQRRSDLSAIWKRGGRQQTRSHVRKETAPVERLNDTPFAHEPAQAAALSRRRFLGGLGGAAAVALAPGVAGLEPAHAAVFESASEAASSPASRQRRNTCWKIRKDAADFWFHSKPSDHPTNGDETRFP